MVAAASPERPSGQKLEAERDVISSLQFLRGGAAVLVVVDHLLERLVKYGLYPVGYRDLAWRLGDIGVESFFAISGFIMVLTAAASFGQRGASATFLARRFFRVAPLYYLTTGAWIAVMVARRLTPEPLDVARSFAFIPYRNLEGLLHPVYAVGWTLNYEMFFYLLFAVAMVLPLRAGLAAVVATLLGLVAIGLLGPAETADKDQVSSLAAFITNPVMLYFALGIAVAVIRRWRGVWIVAAPNALICLCALALLILATVLGAPHLPAVAAAVALTTLLRSRTPSAAFDGLARALGDASYSIYLTHSFLLGVVAYAFFRLGLDGAFGLAVYIPAAAIVAIAVGWLTWFCVEKPLGRFLKRRLLGA